MMLVLLAMGIYGSGVVGWQIRTSNDIDVVAKAKDLHPKLALGMTGFFALGAVGEQGGRVGGGRGAKRRVGGGRRFLFVSSRALFYHLVHPPRLSPGGIMSCVMQGVPILSSAHSKTAIAGLLLLALQGMLSAFFADDPGLRTTHAFLGTGILGLFLVHAVLGLQLGLSIA